MTDHIQFYSSSSGRHPQQKRTRRRQSIWRKVFLGVLLFFVVTFTTLCVMTGSIMNAGKLLGLSFDYVSDRVFQAPPFEGKKQVAILLLGADVSFDGSGEARTDTIKFINVDFEKSHISILSIPRDTWVLLPDGNEGRINGAYQLGGRNEASRLAMAKSTVETLLSDLSGRTVKVDHYIRIQPGGFEKIIDALGGIDIDVEKKMDYEDPSQELYIHLKPGLQHLNGNQTMGYVRFRHDADGDYGRIRRQDQFIRTLAAEMRTMKKDQLARLIGPMMDMLVTDIRPADAEAVKRLADKIGLENMQSAQLPTVPIYKGAAAVVEVQDRVAAAQVLDDILDGPRTTVAIVNGTKQRMLASMAGEAVDPETFNVVDLGTAETPVAASAVYASEQRKDEAEELAAHLGLSATVDCTGTPPPTKYGKLSAPATPAQITIVLGKDYIEHADAKTLEESRRPLPGN